MKIRFVLAVPLACLALAMLWFSASEPAAYADKVQAKSGQAEPDQPAAKTPKTIVPRDVAKVLSTYCADCHGPDEQKGRVRFDTLTSLAVPERDELLSMTNEVVHFEEMPPDDKPQPTEAERKILMDWLSFKLGESADENLRDKLRYPHYGNSIEHELLFSGEIDAAAYSPARRWLVRPQIFHERVMDIFELQGRDRDHMINRKFYGVTNPFVLPDHSGVRDYDTANLNGGHLLVMLGNAKWIAERQVIVAKALDKSSKITFKNPKDNWLPRTKPESYRPFNVILTSDTQPTDEQMADAIQAQFARVLQRPADAREIERYLPLLRKSIDIGGNENGLRQMLVAVLLESEFVYRLEFGGGQADKYGRQMLTPREAAFAISYALGDRKPDAALLQAVEEGNLTTKADYEREVRRLLADDKYYQGQVDSLLDGKHYKSNTTSHPKIVRFFREFFGYTGATKIFKDSKRSDDLFQNPSRGTEGTGGRLILETDRIVTDIVEQDEKVFENLLLSDEFYVYDEKPAETYHQTIAEWREVYETLKDTAWRTDIKKVYEEHLAFLESKKSLKFHSRNPPGALVNYMHFFEDTFGKGMTPFPREPWSHGYTFNHAPLYSLPPTPLRGRYGDWKSSKYTGDRVADTEFWDYPIEQPFKIENRKGILTHPSWLIAMSTNFHSDPIRRGRWIREKLLAGRVPDVPITVDAQVPDDPHRTFRDRVVEVTGPPECWKCHKHMNPLGLPFEAFDDFGRFRTEELLEHPKNEIKKPAGPSFDDKYPKATIAVNGALDGTGDSSLDGEVKDAFELIDRLAKSDRARQSIIRHAFRFYMGRNETLSDSQTLIDADRAYLESGGSFKAVIVSLLTSDSFMYRKDISE
ncbi:MAG: DUF1588 domain-containing protein [Phycisphaeraceae bacterium]